MQALERLALLLAAPLLRQALRMLMELMNQ